MNGGLALDLCAGDHPGEIKTRPRHRLRARVPAAPDTRGAYFVTDLAREIGVSDSALYQLERSGHVSFTRATGNRLKATPAEAAKIRACYADHLAHADAGAWLTRHEVANLWGCAVGKVWKRRAKLITPGVTVRTRQASGVSGRAIRYHPEDVRRAKTSLPPLRLPSYAGRIKTRELAALAGVAHSTAIQWLRRSLDWATFGLEGLPERGQHGALSDARRTAALIRHVAAQELRPWSPDDIPSDWL